MRAGERNGRRWFLLGANASDLVVDAAQYSILDDEARPALAAGA